MASNPSDAPAALEDHPMHSAPKQILELTDGNVATPFLNEQLLRVVGMSVNLFWVLYNKPTPFCQERVIKAHQVFDVLEVQSKFVWLESLTPESLSAMLDSAANETNAHGKKYTHIILHDARISFDWSVIVSALLYERQSLTAACPLEVTDLNTAAQFIQRGIAPGELHEVAEGGRTELDLIAVKMPSRRFWMFTSEALGAAKKVLRESESLVVCAGSVGYSAVVEAFKRAGVTTWLMSSALMEGEVKILAGTRGVDVIEKMSGANINGVGLSTYF
jgi:hypothetical protein